MEGGREEGREGERWRERGTERRRAREKRRERSEVATIDTLQWNLQAQILVQTAVT